MGKVTSSLHPSIIQYLVAHTGLSSGEVRMLHACFRKSCKSSSAGGIDLNRVQFASLYKQSFPEADSLRFSEIAFRLFDADDDDKINFNDFVTFMNLILKGQKEDKVNMLFQLYDLTGNQVISRHEAGRVIGALHDLNGGLVPRESAVSDDVIVNAVFRHLTTSRQAEMDQALFVKLSQESATLRFLLDGTLKAICQPFLKDQFVISVA